MISLQYNDHTYTLHPETDADHIRALIANAVRGDYPWVGVTLSNGATIDLLFSPGIYSTLSE